jgi:hypothetical protein
MTPSGDAYLPSSSASNARFRNAISGSARRGLQVHGDGMEPVRHVARAVRGRDVPTCCQPDPSRPPSRARRRASRSVPEMRVAPACSARSKRFVDLRHVDVEGGCPRVAAPRLLAENRRRSSVSNRQSRFRRGCRRRRRWCGPSSVAPNVRAVKSISAGTSWTVMYGVTVRKTFAHGAARRRPRLRLQGREGVDASPRS